jgi:hypothetical protein
MTHSVTKSYALSSTMDSNNTSSNWLLFVKLCRADVSRPVRLNNLAKTTSLLRKHVRWGQYSMWTTGKIATCRIHKNNLLVVNSVTVWSQNCSEPYNRHCFIVQNNKQHLSLYFGNYALLWSWTIVKLNELGYITVADPWLLSISVLIYAVHPKTVWYTFLCSFENKMNLSMQYLHLIHKRNV